MSTQAKPGPSLTAARIPFFRRIWIALAVLVTLVLLVLLPPYLNVNRLQRRITASISASLGRPVHLDNVSLTLLPFPGFTLDNFVVSEDPAFGFEPTVRANTVTARIRLSTLWRRRIEISRITFTDPSVNIVRTGDGKWNVDSILLQAARIPTAPTAQRTAGPAPRFPYIEATGARLNLKLDQVKTPFSLTEADFSLSLPSPETWHFRITARPVRTDLPVGYSGVIHLEGTLGRAPALSLIPIELRGEWSAAPLGEVSRILLGKDAGWRGDMALSASTAGTIGSNNLSTTLRLTELRRIDFVPPHPLTLSAACDAIVTGAFTTIPSLQCAAPAGTSAAPFTLTATVPDTRRPMPSSLHANLASIPASLLVPALQTFSTRIPSTLVPGGTVSGDLDCDLAPCDPSHLIASLDVERASLLDGPDSGPPVLLGDLNLHTLSADQPPARSTARRKLPPLHPDAPTTSASRSKTFAMVLSPTHIDLGAHDPATLEGRLDLDGFNLRLTGPATSASLIALDRALPQIAEGDPESALHAQTASIQPLRLNITVSRTWSGSKPGLVLVAPNPPPVTPAARRTLRRR